MHAHDIGHRHREHAERIVLTQIVLGGEWKLREVGKFIQVGRMHAGRIELLFVMRHALIGRVQRLLQPL
jgi:hypothetical protein